MTQEELYDEAVSVYENGDTDGAIEKMSALCEQFPDFALPHTALSVWYFKKSRFDESLVHARKTTELAPDDSFSFAALSILAQRAGDHGVAEQALYKSKYME